MSKNTRNRILLTALAALLLVTLTIGGTVAWLQDKTEAVMNTFTTSNVDIKLEEKNPANQTAKMVPGATIAKDPKVTVVKGSEACWLFVEITETNNTFGDNNAKCLSYDVQAPWQKVDGTNNVYYTTVDATTAAKGAEYPVISSVTVNPDMTNADMDKAEENHPTLTFTAYAIQSANLKDSTGADVSTAAEAWKLAQTSTTYNTPADSKEGTTVTTTPAE